MKEVLFNFAGRLIALLEQLLGKLQKDRWTEFVSQSFDSWGKSTTKNAVLPQAAVGFPEAWFLSQERHKQRMQIRQTCLSRLHSFLVFTSFFAPGNMPELSQCQLSALLLALLNVKKSYFSGLHLCIVIQKSLILTLRRFVGLSTLGACITVCRSGMNGARQDVTAQSKGPCCPCLSSPRHLGLP